MKTTALVLLSLLSVSSFSPVGAQEFKDPLPEEPIPSVAELPAQYPQSWIFAHDLQFNSLLDGKVVVIDVAAETQEYKGHIGAGQFAAFLESKTRPELYTAETFYSRRTHGERTDTITIYDKKTLAPTGEIILPGNKRGMVVPQKAMFEFTDGERLGLVFNFTPAASVSIVDFEARKVVNDVDIPGCSLAYPTGKRGFSSLCGNGTMISFALNADGTVAKETKTAAFNDLDNDPLFMNSVTINGMTYFVSFKGQVQPVDLSGDAAKVGKAWSLLSKDEAAKNWRPSGWQMMSSDKDHLYVIMRENAVEGDHKFGGAEVWVYDVKKKSRVQKIALKSPGFSMEVTPGTPGYLVVVNGDLDLDVYDSKTGNHIRTIGGGAAQSAFALHAAR